nr:sensor histidine kinase [Prosthecomicrobium hirschii]
MDMRASESRPVKPQKPAQKRRRGWQTALWRLWRSSGTAVFSSLTRRIVILNLFALIALLSGILYLNQFRAGLIDARLESLMVQGEIIAAAVASSATVNTDQILLDPDELLKQDLTEKPEPPGDDTLSSLDFPINPERVAPVLRRLVSPTKTRARIYDRDGFMVIDSRNLYRRGDFGPAIPAVEPPETARWFDRFAEEVAGWFRGTGLPVYRELGFSDGKDYPEVAQALTGASASVVRRTVKGELIVSVAVPIQRNRTVLGSLMLSTQGGDIDAIVRAERLGIIRVFLVAAGVTILLSVLLAGTIAGPMRRLAAAADRVRRSVKAREEIPDFSARQDEIGHLSRAFRDMTNALYLRMDAIEHFAADVAHELKNPLTSLRSAVETLPLARSDESRGRLLEVIQHDVRRLDRLISDISDASRLDAELAREEAARIDVVRLVEAVVSVQHELALKRDQEVRLIVAKDAEGRPHRVMGHDSRLGQVVTNLVDNARSFSAEGAEVRVTVRRVDDAIEILVDDDGPGIRPDAIERIFERFYTDRPEQEGFGNNSGLGLAISRQIVEAHQGTIEATNRLGPDGETVLGARFTVRIPAA